MASDDDLITLEHTVALYRGITDAGSRGDYYVMPRAPYFASLRGLWLRAMYTL